MKTIYRIARAELATLFYSPVAWLVLIIFAWQSGLDFTDRLQGDLTTQDGGWPLSGITFWTFLHPIWGFFKTMADNLYLYVPLLTMGLMSRETSSGSIKLLLSSPVRISRIVLGKFGAMMVYNLLFVLILLLIMIGGDVSVRHLDFKVLFAGLLGIYLLVCAYSAIGLFMSSLTSYQVVASISTLAVLAILNYIRKVGQGNDFFREITYFLSLSGRTTQFVTGLVTTRDVGYFILVILLFLGITQMKLQDGRALRPWPVKAVRYSLLVVCVLGVGYLSSLPVFTLYADMTVNKNKTLTPTSQAVVARIHQPITVTAYTNILAPRPDIVLPTQRNDDVDYWQPYLRFLPNMHLKYVYYYDTSEDKWLFKHNEGLSLRQIALRQAEARDYSLDRFLTPSEMRKQIDFSPEEHRVLRQVVIGDQKTYLRMYDDIDPNPSEAEITAGLKRFFVRPPSVVFLTGEHERDIHARGEHSYRMGTAAIENRKALVNQGFDVTGADSLPVAASLPAADILGVIDPRTPFSAGQLKLIGGFIASGGNMIIAGEPGKGDLLNPLLNMLGVRIRDGILIEQSKDNAPDYVDTYLSATAPTLSGRLWEPWHDSTRIVMSGAAVLDYTGDKGFSVNPLVMTNARNTWNKVGAFAMDTGKVTFNPEHGDVHLSLPVVLALSRKVRGKEQRILVLGDADCLSNKFYPIPTAYFGNYQLGMEAFTWLSGGEYPVDTSIPPTDDNSLRINKAQLSLMKWLLLGLVPGMMLVWGSVLLISRKRR